MDVLVVCRRIVHRFSLEKKARRRVSCRWKITASWHSLPSSQMNAKVFINYRREDTAPYAGRLYDRLIAHFGEDQVFIDIDQIEPEGSIPPSPSLREVREDNRPGTILHAAGLSVFDSC